MDNPGKERWKNRPRHLLPHGAQSIPLSAWEKVNRNASGAPLMGRNCSK
jgi:hypothetical protein